MHVKIHVLYMIQCVTKVSLSYACRVPCQLCDSSPMYFLHLPATRETDSHFVAIDLHVLHEIWCVSIHIVKICTLKSFQKIPPYIFSLFFSFTVRNCRHYFPFFGIQPLRPPLSLFSFMSVSYHEYRLSYSGSTLYPYKLS